MCVGCVERVVCAVCAVCVCVFVRADGHQQAKATTTTRQKLWLIVEPQAEPIAFQTRHELFCSCRRLQHGSDILLQHRWIVVGLGL